MDAIISVIIPCFNGVNYLAEAVAGIRRQNMPLEILLVDDGSTDATAVVAKDLDCIVTSIPNSGLSAARNEGLTRAKGDYILFHDHDDVLREGALERLHAELRDNGAVSIAMAMAKDFISPELDDTDKKLLAPRSEAYYGLLSGAVLIRRDIFGKMDAFTEDLATGQTMDFLFRAKQAGVHIQKFDFIAVDRRLHNSNMGRSMRKQEHKDYADILRAKLRRG